MNGTREVGKHNLDEGGAGSRRFQTQPMDDNR